MFVEPFSSDYGADGGVFDGADASRFFLYESLTKTVWCVCRGSVEKKNVMVWVANRFY